MANHLTRITTRAKQIYKAHPSKKWIMCVKQAAAELKKGKKVGTRPKAKRRISAVKRPKRRIARVGVTSSPGVGIQTVSGIHGATESQLRSAMLLKLEQVLGRYYVSRDRAKLKRDKKKWGKLITATKAKIRKHRA